MTEGKTPHRTIRIEDKLWKAAQAKAKQEQRTMTDVIREHLQQYIETRGRP